MSTILRSLKKLEEEKSLLEKNINLKNLMIQEGPQAGNGGKSAPWLLWGLGITLVVSGVFLGGMATSWYTQSNSIKQVPIPVEPKVASIAAPDESASGHRSDYEGIPLSSIPVTASVPETQSPPFTVIEEPEPQVVPEKALPQPVVEIREPEPAPLPAPPASTEVEAEVDEELADLIERAQIVARSEAPRKKPVPASAQLQIPGFKLKGIIFFDDGSPSNYIFYSTPDNPNQKLQVGESALGATLQRIDPEKAVFDYKGQPLEIDIGG